MVSSAKRIVRRLRKHVPISNATGAVVNPFVETARWVVQPWRFPVQAPVKRAEKVRIALISMPEIDFTSTARVASVKELFTTTKSFGIDPEVIKRSIVSWSRNGARAAERAYLRALHFAARELRAHIICFNELAIPAVGRRPPRQLFAKLQREATNRGCLIIAGSMHDGRTFLNTGFIFHAGGKQPVAIHKHVSAISMDERITIPPLRKVMCTRIFGLNVAILICLDLADFSVASAVVRMKDKVDVLFICCYTRWVEPLEKIAAAIGEAAACTVFLVNFNRPGGSCRALLGPKPFDLQEPRHLGDVVVNAHLLDVEQVRAENQQTLLDRDEDTRSICEPLFGAATLPLRRR